MRKLIVVTMSDVPEHFYEWADEVVPVDGVDPSGDALHEKSEAIKLAMISAVEASNPGDVISQEDIFFDRDPFKSPLIEGMITQLTKQFNPRHWCPRAFRFADESTAERTVEFWKRDPLPSCYGWMRIPMKLYLCGRHGDASDN